LESGHIKPKNDWCDIIELVYEVVKRVEENNPSQKINISVNQDLPLCSLDKGMLDQVIYNLLNNAAVHTEPGTKISITVNCHVDLLEIKIEDQGQGFREVDIKDVFRKFSRNKVGSTSGSGLGLSIVKGFTEALGGSVELRKGFNGGALFTILIPVKTSYMLIPEND
jgi:two-component system, OmpR family, sensor histidine kinase KdpD